MPVAPIHSMQQISRLKALPTQGRPVKPYNCHPCSGCYSCVLYIMQSLFYGAIRKIMSSHVNHRSVLQTRWPLICKASQCLVNGNGDAREENTPHYLSVSSCGCCSWRNFPDPFPPCWTKRASPPSWDRRRLSHNRPVIFPPKRWHVWEFAACSMYEAKDCLFLYESDVGKNCLTVLSPWVRLRQKRNSCWFSCQFPCETCVGQFKGPV